MAEQIITKRCSRCKELKPLSEFYKNLFNKDGYQYFCKICGQKYLKKYRQTEKYKMSHLKANIQFQHTHQDNVKANRAIHEAIRDGKLPSPDSLKCVFCGKFAYEYHHHLGYEPEHWLDVVPICWSCHRTLTVKS